MIKLTPLELPAEVAVAQRLTGCLEGAKTFGVEAESFRARHQASGDAS